MNLGDVLAFDGGGMDVGGVAGLVEVSSLRNVLLWERAFVRLGKVHLGRPGIHAIGRGGLGRRQVTFEPSRLIPIL